MKLVDYIQEFSDELAERLLEDERRWGETWRYRTREGQEERILNRIDDYRDQFLHGKQDFDYMGAVGNLFIGWVRIKYPEELLNKEGK